MKSGSDKSVIDYLRSGGATKPIIILAIGLLLLIVGGFMSKSDTSAQKVENETAKLCSMVEGVGECEVMLTYREVDGEKIVYSVAIICQGAESAEVRRDLTKLVSSLYGVGAHRISILKLEKENR